MRALSQYEHQHEAERKGYDWAWRHSAAYQLREERARAIRTLERLRYKRYRRAGLLGQPMQHLRVSALAWVPVLLALYAAYRITARW